MYIGWHRLRAPQARRPALTVTVRPVLFAALLAHGGQLGPAEIPAKRVFTSKDVWRRCAELDLQRAGMLSPSLNFTTLGRFSNALPG